MTSLNITKNLTPRTVIRGESNIPSIRNEVAFIDWLGFTIKTVDLGMLREALIEIFNLEDLEWNPTNRGWAGYKHKIDLGRYGWLAHGGESQKNTINIQLRPAACRQFKNVKSIIKWANGNNAKITRCDLAHDDFEGKTINIEKARKWNEEGGFTFNGRKPKPREIINHDTSIGNTFYIGKRENGKMLRIYEKGKEQGDPESKWIRVEVELRNKDRVIPWEILLIPSEYLSGAYPCLSFLFINQNSIKTAKKSCEISYEKLTKWARTACGKTINAMLINEGGDYYKIIKLLKREGWPSRLEPYHEYIK